MNPRAHSKLIEIWLNDDSCVVYSKDEQRLKQETLEGLSNCNKGWQKLSSTSSISWNPSFKYIVVKKKNEKYFDAWREGKNVLAIYEYDFYKFETPSYVKVTEFTDIEEIWYYGHFKISEPKIEITVKIDDVEITLPESFKQEFADICKEATKYLRS